MLRLEARPVPSQVMTLASPVIALLLTALVAALILVGLGKDPVSGLRVIFIEPLSNRRQISEVLGDVAAPLSAHADPAMLEEAATAYKAMLFDAGLSEECLRSVEDLFGLDGLEALAELAEGMYE